MLNLLADRLLIPPWMPRIDLYKAFKWVGEVLGEDQQRYSFSSSVYGLTERDEPATRMGLRAAFNTLVWHKDSLYRDELLLHQCWYDLVGEYSARHLTQPTDRIKAIAGLKAYFPLWFESGILFGESKDLNIMGLLWFRANRVTRGVEDQPLLPWPKRSDLVVGFNR